MGREGITVDEYEVAEWNEECDDREEEGDGDAQPAQEWHLP